MPIRTNALTGDTTQTFLTDGGLETTLLFHEGIDLPHFAAVALLDDERGIETLRNYYHTYADIAVASGLGFVLETPTWRASSDWAALLGYNSEKLAELNRRGIELMQEIRDHYAGTDVPFIISGNLGPRGDGYVAGEQMSIAASKAYHYEQIATMADAGAEQICAITMTNPTEAAGIANAAAAVGLPVVIGFTTETDGRLPDGTSLPEAIEFVDESADTAPAFYIINCAHVDHFSGALNDGEHWTTRIRGVRANASRLSHAELDECEELDDGDPREFAELYRGLSERFPQMHLFGGCCGTDHRHIDAVCKVVA